MRTGRPKVALVLTDDERRRLVSLSHRSRSVPHLAMKGECHIQYPVSDSPFFGDPVSKDGCERRNYT
jgi:hypothetical protein